MSGLVRQTSVALLLAIPLVALTLMVVVVSLVSLALPADRRAYVLDLVRHATSFGAVLASGASR